MTNTRQMPAFPRPPAGPTPVSPLESARYTGELLESLRKIAASQGHGILAHLLELAQSEARMIARDHKLSQAIAPYGGQNPADQA